MAAGYLATAAIVVEVVRILKLRFEVAAQQFGPAICGIILAGLIGNTSWYQHLPFAWQALLYCAYQALFLIWIVSWESLQELFDQFVPWRPRKTLSSKDEKAVSVGP